MTDFDAKEAADHCLHPVARFNDLPTGNLFRFPGSQVLFVKTKRGYRKPSMKVGEYRTGSRTAVIPLDS